MILKEIVDHKRQEVAARKTGVPRARLDEQLDEVTPPRGFARALRRERGARQRTGPTEHPLCPALIAEIKGRSPSRGEIRENVDAPAIARLYEEGGASCISVLTDSRYFGGAMERIPAVRAASSLPVLQKDFIIDPYQVVEARCVGADCILLIISALDPLLLRDLHQAALALALDALVEVHDEAELDRALELNCELIGVNNRNLQTFEVSLETTERLAPRVPDDRILVGESGIHGRVDMERLAVAGVDAVLVGEALMASDDIAERVRELLR